MSSDTFFNIFENLCHNIQTSDDFFGKFSDLFWNQQENSYENSGYSIGYESEILYFPGFDSSYMFKHHEIEIGEILNENIPDLDLANISNPDFSHQQDDDSLKHFKEVQSSQEKETENISITNSYYSHPLSTSTLDPNHQDQIFNKIKPLENKPILPVKPCENEPNKKIKHSSSSLKTTDEKFDNNDMLPRSKKIRKTINIKKEAKIQQKLETITGENFEIIKQNLTQKPQSKSKTPKPQRKTKDARKPSLNCKKKKPKKLTKKSIEGRNKLNSLIENDKYIEIKIYLKAIKHLQNNENKRKKRYQKKKIPKLQDQGHDAMRTLFEWMFKIYIKKHYQEDDSDQCKICGLNHLLNKLSDQEKRRNFFSSHQDSVRFIDQVLMMAELNKFYKHDILNIDPLSEKMKESIKKETNELEKLKKETIELEKLKKVRQMNLNCI